MKLKLEYDLPNELDELELWYNAAAHRTVLYETFQYLRENIKHGDGTLSEAYDELWRIANEEGIDLWTL